MKKLTFHFRSINSNIIEKQNRRTNKKSIKLEFDRESIEEHNFQVTMKEILTHKSWFINFFLSFMIILPVAALIYATIKIGLKLDLNPTDTILLISISLFFFIIIWVSISIPSSIKYLKKEFIEEYRGKGNWKIIDDHNWENFNRLLNISNKDDQ